MSTMTLKQVSHILRKAAEDVVNPQCRQKFKVAANTIDALLRERESAKAGVTDEMALKANHIYASYVGGGIESMRAALEAVAPMLASARVPDETGWLIESTFGASSPSWWTGIPEGCGQSFTTDANKAVRFCRKGDAEAVAKHMRRVIVTEHKWLAAAPKP